MYGGQSNINSLTDTTSSPIQIPSHTGLVGTTSKPIGLGNPFLDGTLGTGGNHGANNFNNDKNGFNKGVVPTETVTPSKPIGAGNPFLTHGQEPGHKHEPGHGHGHGHVSHKGDSPIYNIGITIGGGHSTGTPSTTVLPSVSTTAKPVGVGNPFFHTAGGKQPTGGGSGNTYPSSPGQSSLTDNGSAHFPKAGHGTEITPLSPYGAYSNINQGIKDGAHGIKGSGGANSNAGALTMAGDNGSSLTGNVNLNKPTGTLSNAPGSYDHKGTSLGSGGSGSIGDKGTSRPSSSTYGSNVNNHYNPQGANAGALSFADANTGASAGANAGSFASSFSSSHASSSSFASSQSGSYMAHGDPNVLQQLNGNWPFNGARSLDVNNPWANAGAQASAFASSNAGSWSGSHPVGVKG